MRFLDLGSLQLEVDGNRVLPGGRRPARVLNTLLLHLDHRVSTDMLLDAVWGSDQVGDAAGALETHIWRLRRLIEPHRTRGQPARVLINDSGGYRLVATGNQVDSARFEQLCLLVVDLLGAGQPERALRVADDALSLWRGAPFEEIADRDWASGPIARLHELQAQLVERRVDCILELDQPSRAVAELAPLLAAHPLRERLWWQRMLALYRTGRVDQAVSAYQQARRALRDQLGVEPGRDLVDLHHDILSRAERLELTVEARPARVLARPVEVRLPRARTLIAREADQNAVLHALTTSRLVTIAGPAGCGKTRLAVNVARAAADRHPDGVWFVDLSDAEAFSEVVGAVVAALGITVPAAASPEDALVAYGRDRRLLILLDNCEQALDAVSALCDRLLEPGLELTFLTTSREPIEVGDEVVHQLGPLRLDRRDGDLSAAAVLFIERAGSGPTVLSTADLYLIERICRSVDGIPLAIELAAALTSTYGLGEIAELVGRDPGGLAAIGHGQARHHQTLSGAIDRSYRLLTATEQSLHRRLSVLPAGFSREQAQALANPDLDRAAVPALLARLAHRSLLAITPATDGTARFQQLVPIRAHAAHHLIHADETEQAEERRDAWTDALVSRRPRAGRPEEREWYQAVGDDLAVIRSTLHRRLVADPDELGAKLAPQLLGFWYYRGLFGEGRQWAEAALRVDTEPGLTVRNQCTLSAFLLLQGRNDLARETLEGALALVQHLDRQPDLLEFLLMDSVLFASTGDQHTAQHSLEVVWPLVEASADRDLLVLHEVMACAADSLTAPPRRTLGRGSANYERALAAGNLLAAWMSCSSVDTAALALRDPATGLIWCRRLLDLQERLSGHVMPHQLETLGDFLALDRQHEAAVGVFSASHHRARRAGAVFPRNLISDELLADCRRQLTIAEFDAAWVRGVTLPWTVLATG